MLLGALPLGASVAHAAPPERVVVGAQGCEGLAPGEVGRLLDLELAMVTTEIRSGPPLRVELHCGGERMTIEVVDPLTRKRLARDIPAPDPEPGRERVVALAISELFAASWLELLTTPVPPPPPPDDPTPPPDPTAVEAARRMSERRIEHPPEPEPAPAPSRRALELLVGAGARGRALLDDGRLGGGHTELRLRSWLSPGLGVVAVVGWDLAQRSRRHGLVRGQVVTAGGGLAWGVWPSRVGVGGHVSAAGGWARVRGLPHEPGGVDEGANAGLTGEVSLGLGPRVHYGRLRLDIDAEAGAMLRAPMGVVVGEPPMSMGGLWAGLALRLGGVVR